MSFQQKVSRCFEVNCWTNWNQLKFKKTWMCQTWNLQGMHQKLWPLLRPKNNGFGWVVLVSVRQTHDTASPHLTPHPAHTEGFFLGVVVVPCIEELQDTGSYASYRYMDIYMVYFNACGIWHQLKDFQEEHAIIERMDDSQKTRDTKKQRSRGPLFVPTFVDLATVTCLSFLFFLGGKGFGGLRRSLKKSQKISKKSEKHINSSQLKCFLSPKGDPQRAADGGGLLCLVLRTRCGLRKLHPHHEFGGGSAVQDCGLKGGKIRSGDGKKV